MWSGTNLPLLCLITQMCLILMLDTKFDALAPSHVQKEIEHISKTYHTTVLENWNKSTIEKDIYATDLTQEEEDNAFLIKTFLQILMNKCMLFEKVLEKFGDD